VLRQALEHEADLLPQHMRMVAAQTLSQVSRTSSCFKQAELSALWDLLDTRDLDIVDFLAQSTAFVQF
jgi:hypothetical protein